MASPQEPVRALHAKQREQRWQQRRQASPEQRVLEAYRLFLLWRPLPAAVEEVDPIRELKDILTDLETRLSTAGVPFVIGGAFALAAQGAPRFTYNLDVMILTDLETVHDALDSTRYEQLSPVSYRETTTDLLIDLHPVEDAAQRWAAEHTATHDVLDTEIQVLSPEGLTLMLLREATQGDPDARPLRLRDIELLARQPGIDWDPLLDLIEQMGYEDAYREIHAPGKPPL